MRVQILDYETNNHMYLGMVASPYHPDNYIVEEAAADVEFGNGPIVEYGRWDTRYNSREDWLERNRGIRIHPDTKIIVAHNAAYEFSWWFRFFKDELLDFLKRGGIVYDTALAHYLLSNQQDIYPPLDEVAPLYGGSHKVDGVKALWKAGVLTADIDPALLHEYLVGPEGDIENTLRVFTGTWSKLQERGMLKMALVRMDAGVYNMFCMAHGLKVDREHAFKLKAENEAALADLQQQLYALLPKNMPEECKEQFSFGSYFKVSALIFGGPVVYNGRIPRTDSEGHLIYKKVPAPYFKGQKRAIPVEECVFDVEAGGLYYHEPSKEHQARYVAGKQKGEPKFEMIPGKELDMKNGELTFHCNGLLTDEQRVTFATAMENEWVGKRELRDGTPVYSTAGDVLEVLAKHNVAGADILHKVAAIEKDLGSFYLKEELDANGNVKKQSGMLQYLDDEDFIHHMLNNTSTVTGRLSSTNPNLQQLPRGDTSRVKEMFVSRWGDDGVILQEDYSALETVGLQVMTRDSALRDALLEGKDMHSLRLASMNELPYEYVIARTKDKTHPDHEEWDVMRTHIKPVAFQYQYGATAYGMAMSTGKTKEFCEAFIAAEKKAFPEVEDWFENVVFKQVYDTSLKYKPMRIEFGEGRYKMVRWGTYTSPSGTTYQFKQVTKSRWDVIQRKRVDVSEFHVPHMRNYPIQGESGFFVQIGCAMLIRWLIRNDFLGGKALPINTVHDANYLDVHKSVLREAALATECIMESIPEVMNAFWPGYNCTVPFPVAGGAGPSMAVENCVFSTYSPKKEPDLYAADEAQWKAEKVAFKTQFLREKGIERVF